MAKQMIDLGLTSTDDLGVTDGDFITTESTAQHQRQLILNGKGEFKQNPTICAGAFEYFDDENVNDLIRAIGIEFSRDGMDVQAIRLSAKGVIESEAFYK